MSQNGIIFFPGTLSTKKEYLLAHIVGDSKIAQYMVEKQVNYEFAKLKSQRFAC